MSSDSQMPPPEVARTGKHYVMSLYKQHSTVKEHLPASHIHRYAQITQIQSGIYPHVPLKTVNR